MNRNLEVALKGNNESELSRTVRELNALMTSLGSTGIKVDVNIGLTREGEEEINRLLEAVRAKTYNEKLVGGSKYLGFRDDLHKGLVKEVIAGTEKKGGK